MLGTSRPDMWNTPTRNITLCSSWFSNKYFCLIFPKCINSSISIRQIYFSVVFCCVHAVQYDYILLWSRVYGLCELFHIAYENRMFINLQILLFIYLKTCVFAVLFSSISFLLILWVLQFGFFFNKLVIWWSANERECVLTSVAPC